MADYYSVMRGGQYGNGPASAGSALSVFPYRLNIVCCPPDMSKAELERILLDFGPCAVFKRLYSTRGWIGFTCEADCMEALSILSEPDSQVPVTVCLPEDVRNSPHLMGSRHHVGAGFHADRYNTYAPPLGSHRADYFEEFYAPHDMRGPYSGNPPQDFRSHGDGHSRYPNSGHEYEDDAGNVFEVGPCLGCKKATSYWCTACGAFSCSKECQARNWETHKLVCSVPPVSFGGHRPRKGVSDITERLAALPMKKSAPGEEAAGAGARKRNESADAGPFQNREGRSNSVSSPNGETRDASGRRPPGRYQFDRGNDGQAGFSRGSPRGDQRHNDFARGDDGQNGFRGTSRGDQRQDAPRNERRSDRDFGDGRQNGNQRPDQSSDQSFNDRRPGNRTNGSDNRRPFVQRDNRGGRFGDNRLAGKDDERSPRPSGSNHISPFPRAVMGKRSPGSLSGSDKEENKRSDPENNVAAAETPEVKASVNVEVTTNVPAPAAPAATPAAPVFPKLQEPPFMRPPHPEKKTLTAEDGACVLLDNDALVTINFAETTDSVWVGPPMTQWSKEFLDMSTALQPHCATAPPLDREPRENELVACLFDEDQMFYRAIVKNILPGKEYHVLFCDFGNYQICKADKMRAIPDDMKMFPRNAIEVRLRNVNHTPVTGKVAEFINQLYGEVELKLKFDGDINNGVELLKPDGESVNENIRCLIGQKRRPSVTAALAALAPVAAAPAAALAAPAPVAAAPVAAAPAAAVAAPAPVAAAPVAAAPAAAPAAAVAAPAPVAAAPVAAVAAPAPVAAAPAAAVAAPAPVAAAPAAAAPADDCSDDDGVDSIPLPKDKPFTLVVFEEVDEFYVAACCASPEVMEFYENELPNQIEETCQRNPEAFYPKLGQLCLAKYSVDGIMYRAYTVDVNADESRRLFFIDYGSLDTVHPRDIRKITPELKKHPALSTTCKIAGIEETPENWTRVKTILFKEGASFTVFNDVTVKYTDVLPEITIPAVVDALR